MTDCLNTPGHVTLKCSTPGCGWAEFVDPLSPDVEEAARGEFRCDFCSGAAVRNPDGTVDRICYECKQPINGAEPRQVRHTNMVSCVAALRIALRETRDDLDLARAVLRRVEWSGEPECGALGDCACPLCFAQEDVGHTPQCPLARAVRGA